MKKFRFLVSILAAIQLVGCSAPSILTASGRVEDKVDAITVPTIAQVGIDLDSGFNDQRNPNSTMPSSVAGQLAVSQVSASKPAMPLQVVEVVEVGEQVRAGQQLVRFDARFLEVALSRAEADQKVAERTAEILAEKESELADQQTKLADQEKKLHDAKKELATKRAEVEQGLAKIPAARTRLEAAAKDVDTRKAQAQVGAGKLQEALAKLPADDTLPGVSVARARLSGQLGQARAGLDRLNQAGTQIATNRKDLEVSKAKATKGLATIRGKQAEVSSGLDKVADAKTKLADASKEISAARTQASSAVEARKVVVERARYALSKTTVTAQSDGTVVRSAQRGEVVVPGAKLIELRAEPRTTLIWVEDTSAICVGAEARISTDATPGTLSAKVLTIGTSAEPPPSSVAASGEHAQRAVPVTLTLDQPLPAGLPVSATINPCQK